MPFRQREKKRVLLCVLRSRDKEIYLVLTLFNTLGPIHAINYFIKRFQSPKSVLRPFDEESKERPKEDTKTLVQRVSCP